MRIFAHPLHPMLVHFPIAFWTLATVCDGCALIGITHAWSYGWIALTIGLVLAVPAIAAGFIDLARLEDAAVRDGDRHMILMGLAWVFYLCALLLRIDGQALVSEPHLLSISLSAVGFGVMMLGGWYGGQLVYHHGAGVKKRD